MESDYFYFKGFRLRNRDTLLKINTDGVLLASWCSISSTNPSILDIGTGGGVIAFLLYKRCPSATILGIDIDADSINEAKNNHQLNGRIETINFEQADVKDFAQRDLLYDLIVSNPPFYKSDLESDSKNLSSAKHNYQLPYKTLIKVISSMLKPEGSANIIVPYQDLEEITELANKNNMGISKLCLVSGKKDQIPNRVMIQLRQGAQSYRAIEQLYIREKDNSYSQAYQQLTGPYYLSK